ncbi:alpha-methylacyl-CoA racemase-like [Dysidea avara]|uniref:alpha-methylacyl-CoA racemase-like n=1 Tax=Dysidea avara TaxID=196820 RepID=UPI0033192F07
MALRGLKVVEMAGLAPAPMAGMILADFGASVVRVDKKNAPLMDYLTRHKRSIAVDLRHPEGVGVVHRLCRTADILIEPYRPGVMEKLGLGPHELLEKNPRLIYSRLTGFGQTGPLSHKAGHDVNYLAISGVLSMLGRSNQPPNPPINLLADFAGGSAMCVLGILLALIERNTSQRGQVVDAAMVEGATYLNYFLRASKKMGIWTEPRGHNLLDSGAPFYEVYTTSDGRYMAVGAIEPNFYNPLLEGLGLNEDDLPGQMDIQKWPEMKQKFAEIFATKTQQQWTEIFSDLDACVQPVLDMDEAVTHPHNVHRGMFQRTASDDVQVCPAPKLSRTPGRSTDTAGVLNTGQHTVEILKELQYPQKEIQQLIDGEIVIQYKHIGKSRL